MLSLSLLADTTWYPVTFDSPLNIARGVFFWLTIALLLACGVFFSIVKFLLKRELGRGLRYLGIGAVAYACLVGIVLLLLTFLEDGIEALLFYPLLALVLAVGGSGIALFFRRNKTVYIVCGCVVGAALIAALVCMGVLFASGDSLLNNWILTDDESADFSKVDQIGLYISAALLVAGIIAATFLLGKDEPKGFDAKSISFAGVAIAMSFALSYLRIVKMPQGGSITVASLLPLMIYSYMFGVKKGVFAGMIYGLLQAVQDPYILHPAQFILDYPVPFACIGFAGVFAKVKKLDKFPPLQIALGGVVAGLARFVCHYFSGVFAFGSFGGGQNAWLYSLIYQSGYVLPDIAIAIAVGILVFSSKAFVKAARKYHPKQKPAEAQDAPLPDETPAA